MSQIPAGRVVLQIQPAFHYLVSNLLRPCVYIESAFEVLRCFFFQDTTPSPYRKVDINSRGLDGKTALHFASLYGFEQIANVLLKHGAIANITDYNRKCTPLHLACQYNHPKVWYIFTA